MTNEQFLQEMTSILEAYPALKNRYKLGRIYELAQGVPQNVLAKIICDVGDAAKNTPSINEFKDAISKWKREYYNKNGRYFDQPAEVIKAQEFECNNCIDSGIVEVYSVGKTELSHHMRCDCEHGKKHWAVLPCFDKALRQAFYTKAPALDNFKPSEEIGLHEKFLNFKEKLRPSEKHWLDLGYRG
jgi:hypothetical protein